ncbi:MAG TPA: hypothetical protein VFW96_13555 [Thermomicrobiales bacterium]|nr:hypothetical protein [Thermomicrobiales bacterium]
MMLIELFAPRDALTAEQRRRVSARLVAEVMSAERAPADLIARSRAMTYVMIHESEALVGGRPLGPTAPPHYVVRVSVPGAHTTDAMRAEVVARVTRVLAEVDGDGRRLYDEPHAWVQLIEVPDGNMGAFGQVLRIGDIMHLAIEGTRPAGDGAPAGAAPETAIDPICGMTVALTADALTLTHDGATHAFCSTACRDLFAAQHGAATAG